MSIATAAQSIVGWLPGACRASLEPGDHLDQPTFHAIYKQYDEGVKAELIGGFVYVAPPMRFDHGDKHADVMLWLKLYQMATPGVRVVDNATNILAHDSEPQPDASLFLDGGQARIDDEGYVAGPPEFVAEVASSSVSYDLHAKKVDYERYGVLEYLVLVLRERRAVWFYRDGDRFAEQAADADGILRSKFLPGLWLDAEALFRGDTARLRDVALMGTATPEHATFAARAR